MILLDTHTLLWWTGVVESKLSERAAARILQESRSTGVRVSSISIWEIALLVAQKKLVFQNDLDAWAGELLRINALAFIPIDNAIVIEANRLPGEFHRDPADRIIVATARILDIELLTADEKIRRYPHVRSIW